MVVAELDPSPEGAGDDRLASLRGQDGSAVERIQQDPSATAALKAHDEVGGQPDALDHQVEPSTHLDQDQREGDGDAEAPVQDVVEEAVPGIVILRCVPPEPLLLEEELAQAVEASQRIRAAAQRPRLGRQLIEPAEIGPDVESRVLGPGDQQRRRREIDGAVGPPDGDRELRERVLPANTRTSRWRRGRASPASSRR
jgi:hypothetical protein